MSTDKSRKSEIVGESFAARLRNARLSKGWTQPQLAVKLEVSNGTVGSWESKPTSRPRPETLRKIANLFEVEVSDFWRESNPVGVGNYFQGASESGDFPTAQKCREHLEKFLATCQRPEHIGWTYYELREKFPLTKFSSKPLSEDQRILKSAGDKYDREHSEPA